jgi:hypothetical protein
MDRGFATSALADVTQEYLNCSTKLLIESLLASARDATSPAVRVTQVDDTPRFGVRRAYRH